MLNPADYVTSHLPTAQAVRDFVNHENVEPDVYLELLYYDQTPKNAMPDGTNNVSKYLLSCSITNNASSDAPRSVNLLLDGGIETYIDWTVDKLRVNRIYTHHGVTVLGPIPRGIFGFQQPKINRLDGGESLIEVTGQDDIFDLSQIDFLNDYDIPRGVDIALCIATILKMDMYRPNEGGRAPSGVAVAGSTGPGTTGGITPPAYTLAGVLATSVTTFNATTGYYESADQGFGIVQYSPYDKAHCDANTFAPISPKNGRPMRPSMIGGGWWLDDALGLLFKPATGEFSIIVHALSQVTVVDPYKNPPNYGPYPSGSVKRVNPASVLTSIGTIAPPLSTWPYDYDGSGPYWVNATASTIAGGGSTPSLTKQPIVDYLLFAMNTSLGPDTVIPENTYYAAQANPSTDPSNPATAWYLPPTSIQYAVPLWGEGWSWIAGRWIVTTNLHCDTVMSGTAHIVVTLYKKDHLGVYTSIATLTGVDYIFANTTVPITAVGTVGAITLGATDRLAFSVQVVVTQRIKAGDPDVYTQVPIWVSLDPAEFPTPTLPAGATYFDYGTNGYVIPPTGSGGAVVWPDSNDPGMCPNGCYTVGLNLPASRLALPASLGPVLATMPEKRGVKHLAAINQLCDMANAYHILQDELGKITTQVRPYFTDDGTPVESWNFSNVLDAPDGELLSFQERLADQTGIANVTLDFSQGQGTSGGIYAERTNDDPSSITSRAHMHRPITSIQQNDQIQTQTALDSIADNHIQQATSSIQAADIVIACMPFLQTYDAIGIYYVDTDTGDVIVDSGNYPFIVTSWTENLKAQDGPADTVSLTAERTVVFT